MALYQPTNITPSAFAGLGNGVVDVNDPVSISWQVNGTSPMTAFQFFVYQNNPESDQVYNSPIITLSTPFYGTDARGNPQFYTYTSESTWFDLDAGTGGIVNGQSYKLSITQYWGANNASSVTQYSPSVFLTRTKPTLTLNGFNSDFVLHAKTPSVTVTATYEQAEGDAINWCRWVFVTDEGKDIASIEDATVLEDTGEIYTGELSYTCDAMLPSYIYAIKCSVQTQSGATVSTDWYYIDPDFTVQDQTIAFSAVISDDSSALVDIQSSSEIIGTPTPSDSFGAFQNGFLLLNSGSSVVWDERISGLSFEIEPPYYLYWSGIFPDTPSDIISISTGDGLICKISSQSESAIHWICPLTNEEGTLDLDVNVIGLDCFLSIDPNGLGVMVQSPGIFQKGEGMILPDLSVFGPVTSITLYGNTETRYIKVSSAANTDPVFDDNTLFLSKFDKGSLNALSALDTQADNTIYRYSKGKLENLYEGLHASRIRDYGIRSNREYYYELFSTNNGTTYAPITVSNTVCKQFSAYYLIEATEDATNPRIYHALNVWKFGNNISAGSVSNNNSPGFLNNFTPYRLRQPISRMGRSGQLQALLSNYDPDAGIYQDTVDMMDALWEASISNNVFFLKDMKGSLHMVHISAPIVQTVNTKSSVQQVTVTVPWEEVGDASNVSLIQLPTDPGWRENLVSQVMFDVDVDTGQLTATYPNQYYGSTFRMEGNDLIMLTKLGVPLGNIILVEVSDGNLLLHLKNKGG